MITMLKSGRLRAVARVAVLALLGSLAAVVPLSAGVAEAAPGSQGYWFVAADGGVFNYGGAGFLGSAGGSGVTALSRRLQPSNV